MKNLILIRHGKLDIFERYSIKTFKNGSEIAEILKLYDSCDLSTRSDPSSKLRLICKSADRFICSGLWRTAASFKRMGITEFEQSELLNEAPLPFGVLNKIFLPLGLWAIVLRLLWFSGVNTNCESFRSFLRRMKVAQAYLESQFEKSDNIAVMSHGFVNIVLKQLFKKKQWVCVEQFGNNKYWSYSRLTRS